MDVGIDTDPIFVVAECHNKVGCLSSNAFEHEQFFYGVGHPSVVFLKNHSAEISNSFGFHPVESDRIDRSFDLLSGQL